MKNNEFLPEIILPKRCNANQLSVRTGISYPQVRAILAGKQRANPIFAKLLARASEQLGIPMTLMDWLYPEDSKSVCINWNKDRKEKNW